MMSDSSVYYLEKPDIFYKPTGSIPKSGHGVIEASAGTGKTYTISKLFLDFIYQGVPAEKCLFITFTRKATAEMQERLRSELENLVLRFNITAHKDQKDTDSNENNQEKQNTSPLLETRPPKISDDELYAKYWVLDAEHQNRIRQAADEFSKVRICTIDSLTHRMLQECGDMTALSANTQVSNNPPEDEAFDRFMRLDVMQDPILRAVAVAYDHFVKIESDTIESDSLNSYQSKYFKTALLAVYQTGAKDTVELDALLQNSDFGGSITLYRQKCISLLEEIKHDFSGCESLAAFREQLNLSNETSEKNKGKSKKKIADNDIDIDFYNYLQSFASNGTQLQQDIWLKLTILSGSFKDGGHPPLNELRSYALPESYFLAKYALPKFSIRMKEAKEDAGIFEHKDFTKQLALDIRTNERLKAKFKELWQIAVVDEFQDTSAEQWIIFKNAFIGNNEHTNIDGARLFIVGDPKQAIYGFRGGDVKMYTKAVKRIDNPPATLNKNFRASASIIRGCNAIFSAIVHDLRETSKSALCNDFQFTPVDSVHEDWAIYHSSNDYYNNKPIPSIAIGAFNETQIALEIEHLLRHAVIKKDDNTPQPIRKIYILGKKKYDFENIKTALNMQGIDYVDSYESSPKELFEQPEIRSLATVMRAIRDPYHKGRIEAALNSIIFGLNLDTLRKLTSTMPLIETCYGEKFKYWHELTLKPFSAGIIFEDLLRFCNFAERLALLSQGIMPYERVRGVVDYLASLSVSEKLSWEELIERMSAIRKGEIQLSEEDIVISHADARVQLLTVHKSKGLEADVVFVLPFTKDSNKPNRFKRFHVTQEDLNDVDDDKHDDIRCIPEDLSKYVSSSTEELQAQTEAEAETLRLFYVALTRASSRLYVCTPAKSAKDTTLSIVEQFYKTLTNQVEPCGFDTQCGRASQTDITKDYIDHNIIRTLVSETEILNHLEREQGDYSQRTRNVVSYTAVSRTLDSESDTDIWHTQYNRSTNAHWNIEKGKNTGLFLHKMFETIDLNSVFNPADGKLMTYKKWSKETFIAKQFARWGNYFSIRRRDVEPATELVYTVLTRPLKPCAINDNIKLPPRFCDINNQDKVCELDFVCRACDVANSPVIDAFFENDTSFRDQLNTQVSNSTLIRGTFDMLFKVPTDDATLVYLVDWKSDSLDGYDEISMRNYIKEHFTLQAAFYAHAVQNELKRINNQLDNPHRYAGMLYVFLRGISPEAASSDGLYFIPAYESC